MYVILVYSTDGEDYLVYHLDAIFDTPEEVKNHVKDDDIVLYDCDTDYTCSLDGICYNVECKLCCSKAKLYLPLDIDTKYRLGDDIVSVNSFVLVTKTNFGKFKEISSISKR